MLNISNGEVEYDHGIDNQLQPRDPDTNATYSCNENYALRGNMTRTCGRNRTWLGEDPECKYRSLHPYYTPHRYLQPLILTLDS